MANWLNNSRLALSGWVQGNVPQQATQSLNQFLNVVKDATLLLEESGAGSLIRLRQLRAIAKILTEAVQRIDFEPAIGDEVKTLALRTLHSSNRSFNSKRYTTIASLRNVAYRLLTSSEYDNTSHRNFTAIRAVAVEIKAIDEKDSVNGSFIQISTLLREIAKKILVESGSSSEYLTVASLAIAGVVSKYFRLPGADAARYQIAAEFRESPGLLPPVLEPLPVPKQKKKKAPSLVWDAMQSRLPQIISISTSIIAKLKRKKKELEYGYLYVAGEQYLGGGIFNTISSSYSGFGFRYIQNLSEAGIANVLKEMADEIQADAGAFSTVYGFVVSSEFELESAYKITDSVEEMEEDIAEQSWENTITVFSLSFANGEI